MYNNHVCYMEGGSIINSHTGAIIENPAILIDNDDVIHAYGDMENVEAKFNKFANGYVKAGMTEEAGNLMLIELSQYKITREMTCYVIRRAVEFTATGFVKALYSQIKTGGNPVAWLESEMKRIPIDLEKKEWG